MSRSLGELARSVGGRVRGDPERPVDGLATLEAAGPTDLAFLTHPRYRKAAAATRAGAVLVRPGTDLPGRDLLEVAEPYVALAALLRLFHPEPPRRTGIDPRAVLGEGVRLGAEVGIGPCAVIGDRAVLGDRVTVGAGCAVGEESVVGDDTVLHPRVVLYPGTRVGARCIVHSGAVLGADGFGFATTGGRHLKIPQVGRVVLEDDVEIGANSAVDRGALEDTVIGEGSKIDDLVMVAHGVRIGPHALLVAQSGIAGSTRLGHHVTVAGQSGAAGHLRIGDRAVVAAKSAVFDDVPDGAFVAGIPAGDHRAWKRAQATIRRLPEILAELRALRARRGEGE